MTDISQYLDVDALNELKQVMGEEFPLLIKTFENDSVVRIELIKEAIASADPDAVRRAAHSFKGSASNMGATTLTELCRAVEEIGAKGETAGCDQLLEQIIESYAQVQEGLTKL
ncbi:MAG: Hpt domain-containing protein [Pseudomonadales bacterium]